MLYRTNGKEGYRRMTEIVKQGKMGVSVSEAKDHVEGGYQSMGRGTDREVDSSAELQGRMKKTRGMKSQGKYKISVLLRRSGTKGYR